MLAHQRQAYILRSADRDDTVRVADLVSELNVSEVTIRRDLDALARRGLVHKVYGGATVRHDRMLDEPGFAVKSSQHQAEKTAISRAAAQLVKPGSVLGLTAGTTTWTLAHHLVTVPDLTVVTNSVNVATVFWRRSRPDHTVVLTGGTQTPSDALVGAVAVSSLRSLHLDLLLLGVHGMHEKAGFTTPNLLEAETDKAFVASARRLVAVADHTKWGVVGLCEIMPLWDVDILVTDDALSEDARRVVGQHIDHVVFASVGTGADGAQGVRHTEEPDRR